MNKFFLIFLFATTSASADIIIVNGDGDSEGLNDPTIVTPVGDNPGTTLGELRLNVLEQAVSIMEAALDTTQDIHIKVTFDPLACTSSTGTLGQAGPEGEFADPETNSFIPIALANQIKGYDINDSVVEAYAYLNSSLDNNNNCLNNVNWYYGYDDQAGDNQSLLSTVLHEMIHGMGFLSYMRSDAFAPFKWDDGTEGFGIYEKKLASATTGKTLDQMTRGKRIQTFQSETDLVWSGDNVNNKSQNYSSGINAGKVQFYAPKSFEKGSSVSHFDVTLSPNEVMEPFLETNISLGLALEVLLDIGWSSNPENPPNYSPNLDAIGEQTLAEDTTLSIELNATDVNDDVITFLLSEADNNLGASINESTLTITPIANFNGSGSLKVTVSDGENLDMESINIIVTPINDAPSISAISDVEFDINATSESTVVVTDVDDTPQITVTTSAPSVVSASLIDTNLTLAPASIYNGSATITITASDGQANITTSFTATVTGGVTPPPLELNIDDINIDNNSIYPADDLENITLSLRGGDSDYNASVQFNGGYRTDLLTNESGNLILKLPEKGAFAGSYELIIDDGNNLTAPIAITIKRPLRIVANTNPTLANTSTAEIKFEGAPAGDTITLVDSEISFINKTGTSISTLTASNDPDNFNQVSTYLDAKDPGSYEITAALLNAPDANKNISVVLTRTLDLSIRDKFNAAVPNTNISIEDDRVAGWNLLKNYQTNQQGLLTLTLPKTSLYIKVAADGFNSQVIQVTDSEASRNVELVLSDGYYRLKGTAAASGFDFGNEAPEVTIELANGNTTSPDTTTFENGVLTFSWMSEIEIASPQSITLTHSGSESQTIALDISLGTEEIDAQLLPMEVEQAPGNKNSESDSGGGNAAWLLITAIALLRRKRLRLSKT